MTFFAKVFAHSLQSKPISTKCLMMTDQIQSNHDALPFTFSGESFCYKWQEYKIQKDKIGSN